MQNLINKNGAKMGQLLVKIDFKAGLPAICVSAISFKVTNTAYEGDPSLMSLSLR